MSSLDGKVAIVTGGAQGIGLAITRKLVSEGAKVMFADLDADATARAEADLSADAVGHVADLLEVDAPQALVDATIARFGTLDIVVNNAGYHWDSVLHKMSDKQWQAMLDIHMTVPFRLLRAVAPYFFAAAEREAAEGREVMRKVVNISSLAASFGNVGAANYAAAKAGMIGLTKAVAKEWGPRKVNVNAAAFGIIQTRFGLPQSDKNIIKVGGEEVQMGVPAKILKAMNIEIDPEKPISEQELYRPRQIKTIPLGRAGHIDEAAGLVYYLCSPLSNYVTGQVLVASGGASGGMS